MNDDNDDVEWSMGDDDAEWSEEEIEGFINNMKEEATIRGGGQETPNVHPGAVMAGIAIFAVLVYSLYVGEIEFAALNSILLVVLALGSKAMNRKR